MKVYIKLAFISTAVALISAGAALAGGLSSRFVQVTLKDLKPGETYSIKEMKGEPLDVSNTTEDITVDIGIEARMPSERRLLKGYEPIPDLSWIEIEKDFFRDVGPGKSIETDISISVPEGEEHAGKKYQVYIYSHTAGKATFRMGLMGRVLIETAEQKEKQDE